MLKINLLQSVYYLLLVSSHKQHSKIEYPLSK